MKTNKELMIERFHEVKNLGFVRSNRSNNTGIGKTFEDYVGVVENNIDAPDLFGFEIKSHRGLSNSYVTLFTKAPVFPRRANSFLKDTFGVPYEDNPSLKKLHVSMFADKYSLSYEMYNYKLINDRENRVIRIGIFNPVTNELINNSAGYTYDVIATILRRKLKNLFYVSAQTRKDGVTEYFHFDRADIYSTPSLEQFLNLLDRGLIMYDIRIGSYASGSNWGKAHDHGSGFRIQEENIHLLFAEHETVE